MAPRAMGQVNQLPFDPWGEADDNQQRGVWLSWNTEVLKLPDKQPELRAHMGNPCGTQGATRLTDRGGWESRKAGLWSKRRSGGRQGAPVTGPSGWYPIPSTAQVGGAPGAHTGNARCAPNLAPPHHIHKPAAHLPEPCTIPQVSYPGPHPLERFNH